ncbi:MAG: DUF4886 domain-containing protein [Pseudomonadota bacterium]
MTTRLCLAFVLLLCVTACATPPQQTTQDPTVPQRILFVGNSFTYYNNSLHNHLRRLISAGKLNTDSTRLRIMTISGGRLPEHGPAMPAMVASEPWDVVVMQGHSRGPISPDTARPFQLAASDFSKIIRDAGAEPVFFMTWAYADKPEMTEKLAEAYLGVGEKLGARVAPVGLAFETARQKHPTISLTTSDKRHPTIAGTYLAASVFYALFFEQSPVGLNYHAGLAEDDAGALQLVAWDTVQAFLKK